MGLQAGTRLGPYEIIAPIGAGGMGEVYRARDAKLNRDVAIKVLSEHLATDRSALERLEREARTLASTSHPNILSIFDFGSSNGVTYAVMELLDGETLRGLLTQGALPPRKAIEYAIQIADGLGAAHERGIVHRDLKPDNLFVTRDGRVKILDFGLARQQVVLSADDATGVAGGTEPGTLLGTVGYMSPEQVRGKVADARSDIFSFGTVLYEMLSGRRAFKGDSAAETLHAILRDDPPDLNETAKNLPPAVDRIVSHCLEKSPDERFQSARDVAFNLKSLGTMGDSSRSTALRAVPRVDARRILTYAVLLAVGGVAGWVASLMLRSPAVAATPVYQRLTFDRGTIGQARFAPDGQTIVYNAAWRGEQSQVFTTRVDSRESRPLGLGHGTLLALSATGELAVGMGDTDATYAGPITLGRVPLAGGAPRALSDDVIFADWSADGSGVAAVRLAGTEYHVEFPIGRTIYRTSASLTHLRVSPRGDLVAFAEHPAEFGTSVGSLVTLDQNGGKRVLSKGWADLWGIAWRPDGREVWFTAAAGGNEYKSLHAVTLDGQERLLARMPGQVDLQDISRDGRVLVSRPDFRGELVGRAGSSERALTWLGQSVVSDLSRDGSLVLFSEAPLGGGTGESVYLRPMDGSPAARLGDGQPLALSPDGKWALAASSDDARLMAFPTGAGAIADLTRNALKYAVALPTGPAVWGRWFPDSRRVIFNATSSDGIHLFTQDLSGSDPTPIGPAGLLGETVSADGRSVVATRLGEAPMLYPLDGATPTPLKGVEKGERAIQWGADGRSLIVQRMEGLDAHITAVDLGTGHRSPLWKLAAADPAGAGPALWVAVTADGRSYAYSFVRDISDLYLIDGLK